MDANQPPTRAVDSRRKEDLIPHIVDYLAKTDPSGLYAEYPVSPLTYDEGFLRITYAKLANAVNGIAWHLKEAFGQGGGDFLAYIGANVSQFSGRAFGSLQP